MRQVCMLIVMVSVILFAYAQKTYLLEAIEGGSLVAIPFSILFVCLLVFFPVMPFAILAGMIGSIFGIWQGAGIAMAGIFIGTFIMFSMARYGFKNYAQKMLHKYPKAKEYERVFDEHAFIGIVAARLIPVIPSPVINILCGISNVSSLKFLAASMIGKLPAVIIFTVAGSYLEKNKLISLGIYGLYFVILFLLISHKMNKNQDKTVSTH